MAGKTKTYLKEYAGAFLETETQMLLETQGQYYQIEGEWLNGIRNQFTVDTNGNVTYNGAGGTFLFNGSSDLKADKVCEVTYALFLNGVNTNKITPSTFNSANSYNDIGITGLVVLERGDTLTVRTKSDTANTTITIANLRVTYWGE